MIRNQMMILADELKKVAIQIQTLDIILWEDNRIANKDCNLTWLLDGVIIEFIMCKKMYILSALHWLQIVSGKLQV